MPEENKEKMKSVADQLFQFQALQSLLKKTSKKTKRIDYLVSAVVMFVTLFTISLIFSSQDGSKIFVKKQDIKSQLISAIENDGNLAVIRNIFENRIRTPRRIKQLFDDMRDYYDDTTPLSKVLDDIRSDLYTTKTDKKGILDRLNKIIHEHQERNPFDALEPSQKDYFENIRMKAGLKYNDIRNEVDKLATELESKNSLVNKYLKQSTTSFWVSIAALIFALAIGLYQIFQNRSSRLRLLIASTLAQSTSSEPTPD